MSLYDFYQRMFNGQQSSAPVNAPNPSAAAIAAPTMQENQQQDFNNAMLGRMGQLGMLLVAAGERMTPRERATILAQAPQYMGGIQDDVARASQGRLMAAQSQEAQNELQRRQEISSKLEDPKFLDGIGMTPAQARLLGAGGIQAALQARASRDPVQEAYMLAQIQNMNRPKWTITGSDEFGKNRYDLVGPNGEIMTPTGSSGPRGGQSIIEQVGDLTGQAALDKLHQISPAIAAEVAGIASSQQPFPSKKMGTPEGALLNALVSQVAGPSFNAMDYSSRQKAWDDQRLNTPNSSGGIRKLSETGLRHFKNLYENSDMLPENHYGPASTLVNAFSNMRKTNSGDASDEVARKLAQYNHTMEIGGDEMAKALGIASEGGREAVKQMFDPSQGRGIVQTKIKNQIKLLGEKLRGQQEDWERVMGPVASKRMQIIQPDVAEILKLAEDEKAPAASTGLPPGVSITRVK